MQSLSSREYALVRFDDPGSILDYAKKLEGHTFREVLELGITPDGTDDGNCAYDEAAFKGGLGNLIEERYFGYRANGESRADFPDAGVELKTTCYDTKNNGTLKAGERLVLGMIAYDDSIEVDFVDSHMWEKSSNVLLVYYGRDRSVDKYDQKISYVALFTPPEEDLAVMREDYKTIQEYVMSGRADELSESLTRYLGACTKGSTAEKSLRDQATYAPGKKAKSRAWCYKVSYMSCVLNDYIIGDKGGDSIIKDPELLADRSFEDYVVSLIEPFVGKTDEEICQQLGIPYTAGKSQWNTITYHMLGLSGNNASEFKKANINARTVRIEESGNVKENMSLTPFCFAELADEEWDDAPLHEYFEQMRFFFVAFQKGSDGMRLKGARFWNMPMADIEGPLKACWGRARELARSGVELVKKIDKKGSLRIENNLPKTSQNPVAHVRPHATRSAYKLADGTVIGNLERDSDLLPDGQRMTKQSFWLNNSYIYQIVRDI